MPDLFNIVAILLGEVYSAWLCGVLLVNMLTCGRSKPREAYCLRLKLKFFMIEFPSDILKSYWPILLFYDRIL